MVLDFIFKKRPEEQRLANLHLAVSSSFSRVRQDTTRIFQWLDYLHTQNAEQQKVISQLQHELKFAPKSSEDIRRIVDNYYSFESLFRRLEDTEKKLIQLEERQRVPQHFSATSERQEEPVKTPTQLQRKIVQRITRNSKEYIKSIMLSMINKYSKVSAYELREMVVEEQGLCSKSSFYRILEELEREKNLGVIFEGKEKVFLPSAETQARG